MCPHQFSLCSPDTDTGIQKLKINQLQYLCWCKLCQCVNKNHISWQTSVISTVWLTPETVLQVSSASWKISSAFRSFECQTDRCASATLVFIFCSAGPLKHSRCLCFRILHIVRVAQMQQRNSKGETSAWFVLISATPKSAVKTFSRSLYRAEAKGNLETHPNV